eukprot:CAMPEP_0173214402 /NCGR_PEP_ID=MMETSP1141-20130122/25928_1 /TAXON_ID=483371 /ORGANISM="non described non described, Strain CCMP2298" /LENGTH=377 /DNA_ID=CAMNT_0014141713 /DNA_START=19 /DNA_END=1151 /DNA_ORIENTATION=+
MSLAFILTVALWACAAGYVMQAPLSRISSSTQLQLATLAPSSGIDYQRVLPRTLSSPSQLKALKIINFVNRYDTHVSKLVVNAKAAHHLEAIRMKSGMLQKHVLRSNLRLVYGVALRYEHMGLGMNDLICEGFKGLQRALEKYDVHKGYAFSTYAYPWIAEYIRHALAQSLPISLPHHVHRLLMRVQSIRSRLYISSGSPPSDEQLCEEMGLDWDRFDVVRRAVALAERSSDVHAQSATYLHQPVRFDEATWERVESQEAGGIEAVQSPLQEEVSQAAVTADVRHAVLSVLEILPADEAAAIYQRLGLADFPAQARPKASVGGGVGGGSGSAGVRMTLAEANILYHKGVRRLRRRIASAGADGLKYPEVNALREAAY